MGQALAYYPSETAEHASIWPTRADLPPRRHARWLPRQKQIVVLAVQSGVLPLYEAMDRYELSIEEYQTWERQFNTPRTAAGTRAPRFNNVVQFPAV